MSLPSGYKRLEYIQSSGTQYIDTLVAHSASSYIVLNADVVYNTVSATNQIMGFTGNRGCGIGLSRSSWWEASSIPAATVGTRYSIEWGVNGTSWYRSVNGVSASGSRSATAFTSNLFLLAALSTVGSTTIDYHCFCKLYGAKITVDGNLVRDYVPCINASGECGLYDKVNAVFYGNAGTGTFTAGPVIAIAADKSEVTKLEYIKSSGVEAINTGRIIYSENMRVIMRFAYTAEHGSSSLFGSEASGVFGSGEYSMVPWGTPQFYVGGSKALTSVYTPQLNEVCTLDITANNGILTDVWNEFTSNSQSYTQKLNHTYSIAIFGNNISGTISQKSSIKLYSFQLYDNGEIVRDYIAAKLADGTVGLYDKLHGLLYVNVGTGTFEAGPISLNLPVNIGGTWKDANEVFVNIGGTWKTVEAAFVNIGGTWKELG